MYQGRYDCAEMKVQGGVWEDVANAEAADDVTMSLDLEVPSYHE